MSTLRIGIGMRTLHVGTRDFGALYELLPITENRPLVRIAGTSNGSPDSWENWGSYIEDYSDGGVHPHHVIIVSKSIDLVLADLKHVYQSDPDLLKPMRINPRYAGALAILTPDEPDRWGSRMRPITEQDLQSRIKRQQGCQHPSSEGILTEPDGSCIFVCLSCQDVWNGGVAA